MESVIVLYYIAQQNWLQDSINKLNADAANNAPSP